MKRRNIGEVIFWGALAGALALYTLTMSNGLPWQPSWQENRVWRYLVAMAGGSAITLALVSAATAAGLLGALVNRYLGWRVGVAAAVVWIFMPGVWNRVIVGEHAVVVASAGVVVMWAVNVVGLWVTRKARTRAAWWSDLTGVGVVGGDNLGAPTAHEAHKKYDRINRIAGWVALGAAGMFAAVSISLHDYRLGEAASVYARLIVEEAGERVILMNGLCDEQIVSALWVRGSALSLRDSDANRTNVVAFAKRIFPGETNLWLEAEISPAAFAEAAAKAHPERFYSMQGQSTTPDKWAARWEAMKPYLKSIDRFIPVMRRAFAYEGNGLGNQLLEENPSLAKQAWDIYYRIFTEVHPNNPAACVNLNLMLHRGYKADESTRQRIESAQADYAKLMKDRRRAMRVARYISHFGPVMHDRKAYEEMRAKVRKHLKELEQKGEKLPTIPNLKTLEEWHAEMMKAFESRDFNKAALIARAILSRRAWRGFIPAHMVLGEKMMMESRWAEAELFLRVAIEGKGPAAPSPLVLNDYAETLRQLKRCAEAEKYARAAVKRSDAKNGWLFRLTLAQVLKDVRSISTTNDLHAVEIDALVKEVLKYAPMEAREMVNAMGF